MLLLLWKRSQIIDKYSEKQEQSITCLHLYQSCALLRETAGCTLWKLRYTAAFFLQTGGIWCDSIGISYTHSFCCTPPSQNHNPAVGPQMRNHQVGLFLIYSSVAGRGIRSATWPTIAQHHQKKCSLKCKTYNPTGVYILDLGMLPENLSLFSRLPSYW